MFADFHGASASTMTILNQPSANVIPLSWLRHPTDIWIDAEKAFGKSIAVPEQVMEGYYLHMIKLYLLKPQ